MAGPSPFGTRFFTHIDMEQVLCAICGVDETEVLATKGDLTDDLNNVICRRCGLVYINPRPTVAAYEAFHVEDFLAERHDVHSIADVAHKVGGADEALKQTIVVFLQARLVPGVRVLDVGCGIGTFLHLVQQQVSDAVLVGIELSTVDVRAAKEFYGLDIFAGSLEQYANQHPAARFDVITLHHTFEHFPEPRTELARMKQLLAPGGCVYIAVPNIMDIRKRPDIFFQKGHPYSYSPATLRRLLEAESYGIIAFHAPAGFPGGMELLAQPRPTSDSETALTELAAGDTSDAVRDSVQRAAQRFSRLRSLRDRLLFFLPETKRVQLTRWLYLLFKHR